jgi:S-adenosylmethionine hydrolase
LPLPLRTPYGAAGEVLCVDRFGNLITNLGEALALETGAREVRIAGQNIPWLRTYADAAPGGLLALINAFGVLEIAARDGSAESRLNVSRGAAVELRGPPSRSARPASPSAGG